MLALMIAAITVLIGIGWRLDDAMAIRGLRFLFAGAILLVGAGVALAHGNRLLPLVLGVLAVGCFRHVDPHRPPDTTASATAAGNTTDGDIC